MWRKTKHPWRLLKGLEGHWWEDEFLHEQGKPNSLSYHFCYCMYRAWRNLDNSSCKNPDTYICIAFQDLFTPLSLAFKGEMYCKGCWCIMTTRWPHSYGLKNLFRDFWPPRLDTRQNVFMSLVTWVLARSWYFFFFFNFVYRVILIQELFCLFFFLFVCFCHSPFYLKCLVTGTVTRTP